MEALPIRRIVQVEIRSRDLKKAVAFYGAVFDWKISEVAPDYALIDTGIEPVAAIMQTPNEQWPVGVCNYVLVPDCDKAGQYAASLGAKIIISKSEVPNSGWFVGTYDPWGNEVFFWQPKGEWAPKLRGPGKCPISWLEIPVGDIQQGVEFYTRLLRWRFQTVEGQPDYVFTEDGGLQRGISLIGGERGARIRGATNYVTVPDLEQALEKVQAAGGTVLRSPTGIPGEGGFFLFLDPEKVRWGVFQAG